MQFGRLFRFAMMSAESSVHGGIHMTIDNEAAREIEWALSADPVCRVVKYGGVLLNRPGNSRGPGSDYFQVDDLVVYVGRMPLDDLKEDRKYMGNLASGSHLERRMHAVCRRYFRILKRQRLQLTDAGFDCLRDDYRSGRGDVEWNKIEFDVFNGQAYLKDRRGRRTSKTLGCLLYTPHLFEDRPAFLHVFAMGGNETFVFSHMLRTHPLLSKELIATVSTKRERFILVEMDWHEVPADAFDLSFSEKWEATVVTRGAG
jgi:hypothetical protein